MLYNTIWADGFCPGEQRYHYIDGICDAQRDRDGEGGGDHTS